MAACKWAGSAPEHLLKHAAEDVLRPCAAATPCGAPCPGLLTSARTSLSHLSTSWLARPCSGPARPVMPAVKDRYGSDRAEPTCGQVAGSKRGVGGQVGRQRGARWGLQRAGPRRCKGGGGCERQVQAPGATGRLAQAAGAREQQPGRGAARQSPSGRGTPGGWRARRRCRPRGRRGWSAGGRRSRGVEGAGGVGGAALAGRRRPQVVGAGSTAATRAVLLDTLGTLGTPTWYRRIISRQPSSL